MPHQIDNISLLCKEIQQQGVEERTLSIDSDLIGFMKIKKH